MIHSNNITAAEAVDREFCYILNPLGLPLSSPDPPTEAVSEPPGGPPDPPKATQRHPRASSGPGRGQEVFSCIFLLDVCSRLQGFQKRIRYLLSTFAKVAIIAERGEGDMHDLRSLCTTLTGRGQAGGVSEPTF